MTARTQTQTQSSDPVGVLKLRSEAEASKPSGRTGPLDGWWRGSRDSKVPAVRPGYPDFYNKTDNESLLKKRQWVKEHLVLSFRIWGDLGFTHGASGHITVKDPILTDHFWMNPIGIHFGDINMSDLVLVDSEGYVTPHGAQLPINQAGFEIHSAIHRARPEAHSAAHCHSRFGRAWSVFGKPLGMNNQDSCQLYKNQGVYLDGGRVAFERSEGELIAQSLGQTYKTGILQNHGLITLGETVDEACYLFNMMEKQCDIQLMIEAAKAGGMTPAEIGDEDAAYTKQQNEHPETLYYEHQADIEHFRRRFPEALTA